jgi:hypothetical protein
MIWSAISFLLPTVRSILILRQRDLPDFAILARSCGNGLRHPLSIPRAECRVALGAEETILAVTGDEREAAAADR